MNEDKYTPLWRFGMTSIAAVLMVFAYVNISGTTLPDNVLRSLMTIEAIGIVIVCYTTVRIKTIRNARRYMGKKKKK